MDIIALQYRRMVDKPHETLTLQLRQLLYLVISYIFGKIISCGPDGCFHCDQCDNLQFNSINHKQMRQAVAHPITDICKEVVVPA